MLAGLVKDELHSNALPSLAKDVHEIVLFANDTSLLFKVKRQQPAYEGMNNTISKSYYLTHVILSPRRTPTESYDVSPGPPRGTPAPRHPSAVNAKMRSLLKFPGGGPAWTSPDSNYRWTIGDIVSPKAKCCYVRAKKIVSNHTQCV
ncbi:hypothetical protein EVAR_43104_1 [Eumeta japonica]|uniref:Uncharacterized protein n=1 Tax=Eumeta variegata TaxID=151549 RepID=A0A4C1YJK2_EUMVA|nr:hypothetical protein EVAR_43104_1 [Eumeta japonica]